MVVRICFVVEDFYPVSHGATTQILLLGERIANRGGVVSVVTRRISKGHPKTETYRGIHVHRVPPTIGLSRFGKYLMILPMLWMLMRLRSHYDVLVVSDFKVIGAPTVILSLILGRKCFLRQASCGEMDGSYAFTANDSRQPLKRKFVAVLVGLRNLVLKRADGFLSISSAIENELAQCGVAESQIVRFTNGTDTTVFKPVTNEKKQQLRANLGLPNRFIFAFSGRLAERKGLGPLLNVWKRLCSEGNDIHLLLIGSGQTFSSAVDHILRQFVADNHLGNTVTFTGHVPNVNEFLQSADCFVFPTEYEALGNSLLEAISCGLPCISTRVGGIVDVITDDVDGILVECGHEEQLLAAMKSVLSDPDRANRLANQARQKALTKFNIERQVELLEEWYASKASPGSQTQKPLA